MLEVSPPQRMKIESFSGAHPYRPQCLLACLVADLEADARTEREIEYAVEHVQLLTGFIDRGTCPRCLDPMRRHFPAGSRATSCRCVPVCSRCGEHEVASEFYYSPWNWPIDDDAIDDEIEQFRARCEAGVFDVGSSLVLTDSGVDSVMPGDTGGWSAQGYDDTLDEGEMGR